jgi:O-antigen ligase
MVLVFVRPQDDRPNMADLHMPMVIMLAMIVATICRPSILMVRWGFVFRKLGLLIALLAVVIIAAFFNGYTIYSQDQIANCAAVLVVCALTLVWVDSPQRLKVLVWTLLACGAYYIRKVLSDPRFMREEISSTEFDRLAFRHAINFGNPNFIAILMVIMGFLALAVLSQERGFYRKLIPASLICGFLLVFLKCQSRGGTLGLAAAVLTFWLLQKRKALTALVVVLTAVIGVNFLAPASYVTRLETIVNYQQDKSATGRLDMWAISGKLISENPLFGIGIGNFEPTHPHMSEHNAYVQVATEAGVPALLLYMILLGSGYFNSWQARRMTSLATADVSLVHRVSESLICALSGIAVQGFFTGFAFREFVWITITLGYCLRGIAVTASAQTIAESAEVISAEFAAAR